MISGHDLREALRTLRRQPAFTIAAIVTFALAIGMTTAIFAALHAVILTPLPFADPERLVIVWRQNPARAQPVVEVSHHNFRALQERTREFVRLAAIYSINSTHTWTRPNGERLKITSAPVTHEFFEVLGAPPVLGRAFLPGEDRIGAGGTIILSDAFWAREFARDPAIVGRSITLNDQPYTIVGVMPREFAFPFGADIWTPLSPVIGPVYINNPSWGVNFVIGRLRPGVSVAQAKQELDTLVRQHSHEHNLPGSDTVASTVTPLTEHVLGNTRPILLALGGTGVIVLAIACANIVGLLLVRVLARRRDSAVRAALGASRWQMTRLWLSESALLAGAGAIGGLILASWAAHALVALAPASTPQLDRITLTGSVLIFAASVCVASALICGLAPAWMATRLELRSALQDGTRDSEGRSRRRARHALVVAQLGLAMVLLVGAGLMIRSVLALQRLDLGYVPERVLTIDVSAHIAADDEKDPTEAPVGDSLEERQRAYLARVTRRERIMKVYRIAYDRLLDRVRALPQVQSAGGTSILPLVYGPIGTDASILLEGQAPFPAKDWMTNPTVNQMAVTEGYFEAMGTRLIKGRLFTARDTIVSPPVVIIGETAARRLFPGRDPIGRQLSVPGGPKDAQGNGLLQTVVGVVADGRLRGIDDVRLDVYMPHQQTTDRVNSIVLRTAADPAQIANAVRAAIIDENPRAVIGRVQTLETIVGTAMAPWRFGMLLFTVLAAVAFALALTGLFGVIAYSVAQRHREMAIRLALGALPSQVHRLILGEGARLIVAGLLIGNVAALAGARALTSVLFGISPADPLTMIAVLALVTLIATAACYLAARRTARINTVSLLR